MRKARQIQRFLPPCAPAPAGLAAWRVPIGLLASCLLAGMWAWAQETSPKQLQGSRRSGPPFSALLGSSQSLPWVNLMDAAELRSLDGEPGRTPAGFSQLLSLAAADFDEDGVADLVVGVGGDTGGEIRLYVGNRAYLYPYSEFARQEKLKGSYQDSPFLSATSVFAVPSVPEVLQAGDFDGDGHKDLLAGQPGGRQLWLLPGTGKGGFGAGRRLDLEGETLRVDFPTGSGICRTGRWLCPDRIGSAHHRPGHLRRTGWWRRDALFSRAPHADPVARPPGAARQSTSKMASSRDTASPSSD